jgi:16S rRNA (cytosine967-C5)-methyltransferase
MQKRNLSLSAQAVLSASSSRPADVALRMVLRAAKGLSSADSREIAEGVFSYFRWYQWVKSHGTEEAIRQATDLADRFRNAPQSFSDEELASRAVPDWIFSEMEVTNSWLRFLQSSPRLWLRTRRGRAEEVRERLWDCDPFRGSNLPDTYNYAGNRDLFQTPEFQAGDFEIQDVSSQAVGLVCAPIPGEKWWDACAGEGGKLLHLSDLMQNKGLILATDRNESRLRRLKQRAARAEAFNYRVAVWNGGKKLPSKTLFDGVLVDAPCSGIGTWQRNPHARWTTTPADIKELGVVQRDLLVHAAAAVKPGGKLVYAVCTLARRETTDTVTEFQKLRTDFAPLPIADPLRSGATAGPVVQILPQETAGNGMFIAAWKRGQP